MFYVASKLIVRPDAIGGTHRAADSLDEPSRSVEAVILTEQRLRSVDPIRGGAIEQILLVSGAQLRKQAILTDNFNRRKMSDVLGSARSIRAEGDQITARLFFADDRKSTHAWQLVRDGHIAHVGIGASPEKATDIPAGRTATIAGRTFTAGDRTLRIVTRWKLLHVAVLSVPLDDAAKMIRSELAGV